MTVEAWMLDNGTTVAIATKDIIDWQQVGSNNSLVDLITNQGRFHVQCSLDKIQSYAELGISWIGLNGSV